MQVKEDDLVELKTGQLSFVLEILTTPRLGYLVEDVDYYLREDTPYPIPPEEIKRVIDDPEVIKRISAAQRQHTIDYLEENDLPVPSWY
jgi:hypothetical protein